VGSLRTPFCILSRCTVTLLGVVIPEQLVLFPIVAVSHVYLKYSIFRNMSNPDEDSGRLLRIPGSHLADVAFLSGDRMFSCQSLVEPGFDDGYGSEQKN
jgi:hypothetical protein